MTALYWCFFPLWPNFLGHPPSFVIWKLIWMSIDETNTLVRFHGHSIYVSCASVILQSHSWFSFIPSALSSSIMNHWTHENHLSSGLFTLSCFIEKFSLKNAFIVWLQYESVIPKIIFHEYYTQTKFILR